MRYSEFSNQVTAAGFTPKDCGNGHWQIHGGAVIVNFYPEGKRGPTIYAQGAVRGVRGKKATLDNALRLATEGVLEGAPTVARDELHRNRRRNIKRALVRRRPVCHWCGQKGLTMATARLDHKLPRSQGGSHREDNLVLACVECDDAKGDRAVHPGELRGGPLEALGRKYKRRPREMAKKLTGWARLLAMEEEALVAMLGRDVLAQEKSEDPPWMEPGQNEMAADAVFAEW